MERMEQMASLAADVLCEELVNDVKEIMSSLEQKSQQITSELLPRLGQHCERRNIVK